MWVQRRVKTALSLALMHYKIAAETWKSIAYVQSIEDQA